MGSVAWGPVPSSLVPGSGVIKAERWCPEGEILVKGVLQVRALEWLLCIWEVYS